MLLSKILPGTGRILGALAAALFPCPALAAPGNVTIADTAVFPESIAADAAGNLYAGSIKGVIYRAVAGSDKAERWITPDETNKLLWVLGVLAHDGSNTLWVCTSPAPFLTPPKNGDAAAVAFDLKTGALKARHVLPAPATCNDITVGRFGKVYIAETAGGRIFSIAPDAKDVKLEVQDPALVGIDGISFDGTDTLYANNTRQDTMLRVNRDASGNYQSLTRLNVSSPLKGPDGLRPYKDNVLLQAETGSSRAALVTITGDEAQVKVIDADTGGSAAITHIGDTAYVAAGKIQYLFDPRFRGQDPGPFVLKAVPIGGTK